MRVLDILNTPWKVTNEARRRLILPYARLVFAAKGLDWGQGWRLYGVPLILRHRGSTMAFGDGLQLRSWLSSNPLGPAHRIILCTWQHRAVLEIGSNFGMTGGAICAAERITVGDRVTVGANSTIIDTDFHPLDLQLRLQCPQAARTAPVTIENDVFIGMNCIVLKGVRLGSGCIVGAGSVVTRDVPPFAVVAGNPACLVGPVPGQPSR
jgi:acetyltransferase-like isoleucine patch superfamily enzyme